MTDEEVIAAVRADKVVGRGTCSVIDECWEASDILFVVEREGITTKKELIFAMREAHEVYLSVYDDISGTAF